MEALDEQDQSELATLNASLAAIEQKIERKTPPDRLADVKIFHLGMVGGSGHQVAKLNKRREQEVERLMDAAKELEPLYNERARLLARIDAVKTGQRAKERAEEARKASIQEEARTLKAGDLVYAGLFGWREVIRANKKSITVRMSYGADRIGYQSISAIKRAGRQSPAGRS